ncbi:MAG: hypothetical protein M5U30_19180 [Burkholderiaceae bacterium]|nr:hypothetical protein [Burkholderiaceae bacterium]
MIPATGKHVGEGFDDPRLDTLFLTLPVSWRGTIAQYAGRLHRLYEGKRDVRIYDYADLDVPMLARMFDRRCRGYEGIGYRILLPASAIPGWPADVPLPTDPLWKRDYSGSVRRLVRDGVDTSLASLFVHAAQTVLPDSDGIARARSASEAFLYRRLESLPETKGRFRLNVLLPIAFDAVGRLESTSCALIPVWRLSWTARSISAIPLHTAATDVRISCCSRTDTWCCAFLLKT